jgi:ribonuclease D|tara:strand:+ start:345 stop:683 length:339 start_codon:yes stop_codon:yes gene_type:complete
VSLIYNKGEAEMTNEVTTTKQTSVTNVDISPIIKEVIEYTKDQAVMKDIKQVLASVPKSSSMDWKLVSGVIMNSLVEWVVENKDNDNVNSLDLIKHLQRDIGYLLERLGLAS